MFGVIFIISNLVVNNLCLSVRFGIVGRVVVSVLRLGLEIIKSNNFIYSA